MSSFSMASLSDWIWDLSSEYSLTITEHAMTGRDTPQARPRAGVTKARQDPENHKIKTET